jgi:sulfatase modifying factor 1
MCAGADSWLTARATLLLALVGCDATGNPTGGATGTRPAEAQDRDAGPQTLQTAQGREARASTLGRSDGSRAGGTNAARRSPGSNPTKRCPPDTARVSDFCIDRYEAHLVVVGPDGRETAHTPYERPLGGVRYAARAAAGMVPQAYISRPEACSGPEKLTYPYGNTSRPGVCNTGKPHLLARLFGKEPSRWSYADHFNSPRLNQQPGFLAATGAHAQCVSSYGVYDLVGNLHEWVSDRVDAALPQKIALQEDIRAKIPDNRGHGIFMGGFYSTTDEHGPGCRFVTIGHGPRYHDYSTGFRCCAEPHTAPKRP